MNDINYWQRFLETGSVSDFLSYRNALQDAEKDRNDSVREEESGGLNRAGIYRDYGNGFKG